MDIWRTLKGSGVKYVKFIIVDIYGSPKCELVPIDAAKDLFASGVPFDASSIPAYATVNKSDFVAYPDPRAVYIEFWHDAKIADVFTFINDLSDKPSPLDPRGILQDVIDKAREKGYEFEFGVEVEFFVVREEGGRPAFVDSGVYFNALNTTMLTPVMEELTAALYEAGLGFSKIHHEVAPSQYEVNLGVADALRLADQLVYFKMMAKDIARKYGFKITFMPKPFWGVNGSGLHTHISVRKDGRQLFASVGKITEECGHVIAGILGLARPLCALVAPTVNSYKRLVPHHEAPTRVVWGYANRSAMIRVPFYKGVVKKIEFRLPDPSMNPYIGFAAMIIAGLKGLEERKEPPPPTEEIAYELPNVEETPPTLEAAIKEFEKSVLARELPGEFVSTYIRLKLAEWEDYLTNVGPWEKTWNQITDWEYKRYLETA